MVDAERQVPKRLYFHIAISYGHEGVDVEIAVGEFRWANGNGGHTDGEAVSVARNAHYVSLNAPRVPHATIGCMSRFDILASEIAWTCTTR